MFWCAYAVLTGGFDGWRGGPACPYSRYCMIKPFLSQLFCWLLCLDVNTWIPLTEPLHPPPPSQSPLIPPFFASPGLSFPTINWTNMLVYQYGGGVNKGKKRIFYAKKKQEICMYMLKINLNICNYVEFIWTFICL